MNDTWIVSQLCTTDDEVVSGITVDNNRYVYHTTALENVYRTHSDGKTEVVINITRGELCGVVWNNNNNFLYICDNCNNRILMYSLDTGILSTLAGNGKERIDGNIKDASFGNPTEIAVDNNGGLYITENHCIRKINLSEGTVITIAGKTISGYQDGLSKHALFDQPAGIAVRWQHLCC